MVGRYHLHYAELKDLCAKIAEQGITPWFMPGADGWQHQPAFFQIGGAYEEATPDFTML